MRIIKNVEDTSKEQEEVKVEEKIEKLSKECTLENEIVELLVKQLQHELENQNIYYSFSVYFNKYGLTKLVKYWRDRAHEEYNHHLWCLNYLLECNADFEYPEVTAIKLDLEDRIEPFKLSVEIEEETTESVNKIYKKALEIGDSATIAFLMGVSSVEGHLISEQSEEQKLSMDTLKLATEGTDWITIQDAIYSRYNNE